MRQADRVGNTKIKKKYVCHPHQKFMIIARFERRQLDTRHILCDRAGSDQNQSVINAHGRSEPTWTLRRIKIIIIAHGLIIILKKHIYNAHLDEHRSSFIGTELSQPMFVCYGSIHPINLR